MVKNPYFKRNIDHSPERITVLFRRGVDALTNSVDQDHADFLEFYESGGAQAFQNLRDQPDLTSKLTRPSYSNFISVDSKRVSLPERRALSQLIREKREKYVKLRQDLERFSYEILPPDTFGSLGLDAETASDPKSTDSLPSKLRIAVYDKLSPMTISVSHLLKDAGIEVELLDIKENQVYDAAILGQGMNADFPEVEFYLSLLSPWAFISAVDSDRTLISQALHTTDKKERSEVLGRIGRGLLEDGRVIPLVVRSYAHVYRKDRLSVEQVTTYDGDIPFWRIQVL